MMNCMAALESPTPLPRATKLSIPSAMALGMMLYSTSAKPIPSTIARKVTTLIKSILKVLDSHFSNLEGSASPNTSAERMSVLILPAKRVTPRTTGKLYQNPLLLTDSVRLLSTRMTPSLSRTARAILLSPRIMTPSMTA